MASLITSSLPMASNLASRFDRLPPRAYYARALAAPLHEPNGLHRRATCGITDNDCGNGYCCSAGHTCETQNGQYLCLLDGDSFFDPISAEPATATTSYAGVGAASSAVANASALPSAGSFTDVSEESSGISRGAIAGIVIGIVAVLVSFAAILFMLRRRKRARKTKEAYSGAVGTGQAPPQSYQPTDIADSGEKDSYSSATIGTQDPPKVPQRPAQEMDSTQTPKVAQLPGDEEMMQRKEAGEEIGVHPAQRAELDGGQAHAIGSPTHRAELP